MTQRSARLFKDANSATASTFYNLVAANAHTFENKWTEEQQEELGQLYMENQSGVMSPVRIDAYTLEHVQVK